MVCCTTTYEEKYDFWTYVKGPTRKLASVPNPTKMNCDKLHVDIFNNLMKIKTSGNVKEHKQVNIYFEMKIL